MGVNEFLLRKVEKGDPISAKERNEIVRLLKRTVTGPNVIETSTGWHIRSGEVGAGRPIMIIAAEDMIADDTEYDATYLETDGTEGATVAVRRPNGVFVRDNSVGFLGRDSSSQLAFIHAHSMPLVPLATDSVGVLTEGAEAADGDTYDATGSNNGCALDIMTRVAYFHAGDEKLYGYTRRLTFDELGHLVTISAETRVEIDPPEPCP